MTLTFDLFDWKLILHLLVPCLYQFWFSPFLLSSYEPIRDRRTGKKHIWPTEWQHKSRKLSDCNITSTAEVSDGHVKFLHQSLIFPQHSWGSGVSNSANWMAGSWLQVTLCSSNDISEIQHARFLHHWGSTAELHLHCILWHRVERLLVAVFEESWIVIWVETRKQLEISGTKAMDISLFSYSTYMQSFNFRSTVFPEVCGPKVFHIRPCSDLWPWLLDLQNRCESTSDHL